MQVFVIPTRGFANYEQFVSILEATYLFRFRFNTREETWWLSILDSERTPIVQGIKIVPGINLLEAYSYNEKLPRVALFVSVVEGEGDGPPGLEDFGEGLRVQLMYATGDDTQ